MSSTQQLLLGENAVNIIPNYIEEVFSTYLYTGTSANQTITNNIDLSTKGGLVWLKSRSNDTSHALFDTVRGTNKYLRSNGTDAETTASPTNSLTAFNTNGFSLGSDTSTETVNYVGRTYASWTFREQPKFFDIVTWTGDGTSNKNVSHNLNSVPGCIIIKRLNSTSDWYVYHQGWGPFYAEGGRLNGTNSFSSTYAALEGVAPTTTVFVPSQNNANINGGTYVAYLFAHNAGGFGLTGTDNVISCGSYTGNGSTTGPTVTLGYEPQWLLIKNTTSGAATSNWQLYDNMRGLSLERSDYLLANKVDAENGVIPPDITPTATGFFPSSSNLWVNTNGSTYIYIAIRRGPMKVPTLGTTVFAPAFVQAAARFANRVQTGFPVDMTFMNTAGSTSAVEMYEYDRLRNKAFLTYAAAVEQSNPYGTEVSFASNTGFVNASASSLGAPSFNIIFLNFQRAPSFFDVVCYTGTGSARTVTHNLQAVPELVLVKNRTVGYSWQVGSLARTFSKVLSLDQDSAEGSYSNVFDNTDPTSSVFTVGTGATTNGNTNAIAAYLFATCAGVSKVGSYTGTGTLQTIPCGFTSGARFVLIKRVDSTGAWYVWDSTRGISSGDDPYLLLNSTAPQVNNTNYVDTDTTGFKVTAAAPAAINSSASGATYIFLAIA
jgi:hypothetical protein